MALESFGLESLALESFGLELLASESFDLEPLAPARELVLVLEMVLEGSVQTSAQFDTTGALELCIGVTG